MIARGVVVGGCIAALLILIPSAWCQGPGVLVDDFEPRAGGWQAVRTEEGRQAEPDPDAVIGRTTDPQKVRSGRHALTYSYRLAPKSVRLLALNRPIDASGTRSLRFWLQTSHSTQVLVSLNDAGGGTFQAVVYSASGAWQDVALNFDEFRAQGPAGTPERRPDLARITSVGLMDAGVLLVNIAPEIAGSRLFYLDDLRLSSVPATVTSGLVGADSGEPGFRVDSFESDTIRWTPITVELAAPLRLLPFHHPVQIAEQAAPDSGQRSLRMRYVREPNRAAAVIRDLEREDLARAGAVGLFLKTERDATIILSLEEKDGSRYQTTLELKAADGWRRYSFLLNAFELANDSQDENNRLDAAQIKNMGLVDFAGLLGTDLGTSNDLFVDEVRFIFAG